MMNLHQYHQLFRIYELTDCRLIPKRFLNSMKEGFNGK